MSKLIRLLGWWNAFRFRATMIISRFGKFGRTSMIIHPKGLLHPVELRIASTDAEVYGQVIRSEEYRPIIDQSAKTIVDCGANIGLTSAYLLSQIPGASVIAIEPFPANAEICRRNLAAYGSRAKVVEAAIWNSCTSLVLEHDGGNEWGVRVRPADTDEIGKITAIDLPSLGLDRIDILKVDIEGSEMHLFAEGTEKWLPLVQNIAIELHGTECRKQFFDTIASHDYIKSQSGELTICRRPVAVPVRPVLGAALPYGGEARAP